MSIDLLVKCGTCGEELKEPTNLTPENRIPCPKCGSLIRIYSAEIKETIRLRDKIGMKAKRGGKGKPFIETVTGDDLHRKTGKWNHIERVIDRETNSYSETITDPDTGIIIHQCEEPLSEHKNHGSAKKKK
jgi:DNA-directed RNA polymerase subunit RPC12/RpoP